MFIEMTRTSYDNILLLGDFNMTPGDLIYFED